MASDDSDSVYQKTKQAYKASIGSRAENTNTELPKDQYIKRSINSMTDVIPKDKPSCSTLSNGKFTVGKVLSSLSTACSNKNIPAHFSGFNSLNTSIAEKSGVEPMRECA